MYSPLGKVTLRSGEVVEAGVVIAPDSDWRERLQALLSHKEAIWKWQIETLLREHVGAKAYFYILHREGVPFSHVLTIESNGVGIVGHVWTKPEDRGQGGASHLFKHLMEHFRSRGGASLYLTTGFESTAYRIYERHGFQSVEPHSGIMAYYAETQMEFENGFFASNEASVAALDWPHYPLTTPLFVSGFPGVIRNAALGLLGRCITEAGLLPPLQETHLRPDVMPRAVVLGLPNGAVTGLAAWRRDELWPDTCIADVYCHPRFWNRASELLAKLEFPVAERLIAYCDVGFAEKRDALEHAGFRQCAVLPEWLQQNAVGSTRFDVAVLEKRTIANTTT
jgi:GNAT superfamily N-acetyltransferase